MDVKGVWNRKPRPAPVDPRLAQLMHTKAFEAALRKQVESARSR